MQISREISQVADSCDRLMDDVADALAKLPAAWPQLVLLYVRSCVEGGPGSAIVRPPPLCPLLLQAGRPPGRT